MSDTELATAQGRFTIAAAGPADGPLVLLLHGYPQSRHSWRRQVPALGAAGYRAVAPDQRGYSPGVRPDPARGLEPYSVDRLVQDVLDLADAAAGPGRPFHLVGHDWGGPTAFALACAQPASIRTLTILDVTIPGIGPDISQGGRRWHHAFHMTPDLPETLVQGREREYLSWFYREFCWQRGVIEEADIDEYVRCYSAPGALRAGFEYYRNMPRDQADNRALLDSGFRLQMPVLALGGARAEARGRGEEPLESLRAIASNVQGGALPDCGHFIPEEQPAALAERLLCFFAV